MLMPQDSNIAIPFLDNFHYVTFRFHAIYPSVSGITTDKDDCIIVALSVAAVSVAWGFVQPHAAGQGRLPGSGPRTNGLPRR